MCDLATVYCNDIVAAKIDGVVRNLRDEKGGQHDFVYGQTDVFPAHIEAYLASIAHSQATDYRTDVINLRLANLEKSRDPRQGYWRQRRPTEDRFVKGEVAEPRPDPFASATDWDIALKQLRKVRLACIMQTTQRKQVFRFTEVEKSFFAQTCPHQYREYCETVATLERPSMQSRQKWVHREKRSQRDKVAAKCKALFKAVRQSGWRDLYADTNSCTESQGRVADLAIAA